MKTPCTKQRIAHGQGWVSRSKRRAPETEPVRPSATGTSKPFGSTGIGHGAMQTTTQKETNERYAPASREYIEETISTESEMTKPDSLASPAQADHPGPCREQSLCFCIRVSVARIQAKSEKSHTRHGTTRAVTIAPHCDDDPVSPLAPQLAAKPALDKENTIHSPNRADDRRPPIPDPRHARRKYPALG